MGKILYFLFYSLLVLTSCSFYIESNSSEIGDGFDKDIKGLIDTAIDNLDDTACIDASGSDVEDTGCKLKLLSGVVQISAGGAHSCALMKDGGVKCWGDNVYGQLGDGTSENRLTPVDVFGLNSEVKKISVGGAHACALMKDGAVKCWGNNEYGQLGDGTTVNRLTPVDVVKLSSGVKDISTESAHSCAIMEYGGVMCWGTNESGELGDDTNENKLAPIELVGLIDVQKITDGADHICVIIKDGAVKCWGNNFRGQIGDGTTENKSTPVDIYGLPTKVKDISAGPYHTCAVLIDGRVMCWGDNSYHQLGDGNYDEEYRTTPVYVIGLDTEAVQVSAGGYHTCALLINGRVMCWGRGLEGQLGDGRVGGGPWAVPVIGISNAIEVSAGGAHSCALTKDGFVYCWGDNSDGQIGDGTKGIKNNRYRPVSVVVCE